MDLIKVLILTLFTTFSSCMSGSIYINGDSSAVNAEVYVDNKLYGLMKKESYKTSNNEIYYYSSLIIKVTNGPHSLKFKSENSKYLNIDVTLQGEEYIFIDFQKMSIKR